ncbi:hypothetical protein [Elizabethkingia anophelis]|uniref:hypothetical protein n=1 Tax=Elizabethkingia anophelis TaxID=1117645 RepID=UPI0038921AEF
MKKKLFIVPLLGILLMFILYGCRTEESTIEKTNNLTQAKVLFGKGNYQFPVLKYTNEIDWSNPIYSQGNGYETVEIPLVLNKGINIGGSVNAKHRLLFRKTQKDNSWDVYYLFILPETTKENIIDNVSFQSVSNDFKGKVIVLNSDNKIVDHLVFSNDIQIQKSASTKLNTIAYAKPDVKCYNYGILYDDGTFEALYFLGCYGGGDGGYNGSGYGGSHGGGSGGGGSDTPPADMVMPPPPKKPILDIKKFLSCFDQSKSANLIVYAQNMLASPPGHAFITIQQGNNIMTFGFYPRDPYLNSLSGRGIMGEDDLHPYNQALNVGTISPAQLQQIISRAIDYASTRYDLAVRNCADFAREALNIANVPGANWDSNWLRPTDIANIINAQKSGVMGSGTSPATQRTCE